MQNSNADLFIKELGLIPHPEGGYFREVYRSAESFIPENTGTERNYMTSIYFLLKSGQFSAFHRLKSDELWYFHEGAAVTIFIISPSGKLEQHILGRNIANGEKLQVIFNKGDWFAATPAVSEGFSLFGCAVAPGFHFDDFELAHRENLIKEFPQHTEIIRKFSLD
ncbi:MAG: cupin domain-containing protein [Ignavibacteriaceae bacterium]|nr:cupin domain-containing protein [Ignavibacteriaceae bacterium]